MKRLVSFLIALVVLAACATAPTPNGTLGAANQAIAAYHDQVGIAVDRGRITPDRADALIAEGEKAQAVVKDARLALRACGGKLPCAQYDTLIQLFQRRLAELERRLREEETKP